MNGPAPTGTLAAVVGVIALLAFVAPGALVVALLIGLALLVLLDLRSARVEPVVVRTLPGLLSRGVPAPLSVAVNVRGATGSIAQPTPAGLSCSPLVNGVGELVASRRGLHVLPPVVVRRSGPLGLGAWTHHVGGATHLRVYPDLPAAQRLARVARTTTISVAGQSLRGPLGLGTDFESLREYRPDDDVRQVNWRATARMRRPMSNTYRVEQSRRVLIVLDCGRVVAAPLAGRLSRLDIAVDAAAAVALSADAIGDRVGLLAFDDGLRASVRPVTSGGRDVLRALAQLEPRLVDSDPDLLVTGLPRGQRTTVLVFTDLMDIAAVRGLAAALPGLAGRHSITVLSPVDSELSDVLARPVRSMENATLVAAAADLVEARLQAAAVLRRAGARVVEAPANLLSAAAVRALTAPTVAAA